jgi:hypothetical protein
VGSNTENLFHAIEYSYQIVEVFNSTNMANHTSIPDVVYVDKHTQPSFDPCMPSLIQQAYGSITAETVMQTIAPVFGTGNMHIAVFDHEQQLMYVANASPYINNNSIPAYQRPFVQYSLTALFAEQPPAIQAVPAPSQQQEPEVTIF